LAFDEAAISQPWRTAPTTSPRAGDPGAHADLPSDGEHSNLPIVVATNRMVRAISARVFIGFVEQMKHSCGLS
jgi:hypothetical protein